MIVRRMRTARTIPDVRYSVHDDCPADAVAIVDAGLDAFNHDAAPLAEVQPMACIVRDNAGEVAGGALGRRWGICGELQQLWVRADMRKQGVGSEIVRRFEAFARDAGCRTLHLETFSFQAPAFYRALGYRIAYERRDFPHGIVKYHLQKQLAAEAPAP